MVMMFSPPPPAPPRPGRFVRMACEWCKGVLGADQSGACCGCGAPASWKACTPRVWPLKADDSWVDYFLETKIKPSPQPPPCLR